MSRLATLILQAIFGFFTVNGAEKNVSFVDNALSLKDIIVRIQREYPEYTKEDIKKAIQELIMAGYLTEEYFNREHIYRLTKKCVEYLNKLR